MRFPWPLSLPLLALAGGVVVACADDSPNAAPPPVENTVDPDAGKRPPPPDVDGGDDSDGEPKTFDVAFPHVQSRGGPIISQPKAIPIVFAGDSLKTQIADFNEKLAGSAYWASTATEYGIGALTTAPVITPSDNAPATTTFLGIEDWLRKKLSGTVPEFGTPNPNAVYAIYFPASTTIVDDGTGLGQSCQGYGGYHSSIQVGAVEVGYAVMPRCSDIEELTVAASHEYFEWATDPFPMTRPAYNKLDDDHWAWGVVMLGELSDLCTYLDREYITPPEVGFQVQRHWSNKLSLAGSFPCAPKKAGTYIQAVPATPDSVVVPDVSDPEGSSLTTKAIKVERGKSRTVDVMMYSDKPGAHRIGVRVLGYEELMGQKSTTGFSYDPSTTYAQTGSAFQVTIQAPKSDGYDLAVTLSYLSDTDATLWPVLVTTKALASGNGLQAGADIETAFRRLAASARARRVPTTTAGLPKPVKYADGSFEKWVPGFGRLLIPPPPKQ